MERREGRISGPSRHHRLGPLWRYRRAPVNRLQGLEHSLGGGRAPVTPRRSARASEWNATDPITAEACKARASDE